MGAERGGGASDSARAGESTQGGQKGITGGASRSVAAAPFTRTLANLGSFL